MRPTDRAAVSAPQMAMLWTCKLQEMREAQMYVQAERSDAGSLAALHNEMHRLKVHHSVPPKFPTTVFLQFLEFRTLQRSTRNFTGFYRLLLLFMELHGILIGFTGFYWVLMGFMGF